MQQDEPQLHVDVPIPPPAVPVDSDALLTPPPEDPAPPADQAPLLHRAPMERSPFNNDAFNPVDGTYVTVTCRTLIGRLHLQMFKCPGIHEPCIEFNGEMLTPKEFTYRAAKVRRMDWKACIHVGHRSLRSMMVIKAIVFYNHEKTCTGKCLSRNRQGGKIRSDYVRSIPVPVYPMAPKYSPPSPQRFGPYPTHPTQQPFYPSQAPTVFYPPSQAPNMVPAPLLQPQQFFYPPAASGDMVHQGQLIHTWLESLHGAAAYTPPVVARGVAPSPLLRPQQFCAPPAAPSGVMTSEHLINISEINPAMFWREVRRVGLLPDCLQMMENNANGLRLAASNPNFDIGNIAPWLTRVIEALDLKPFVVSRIQMQQASHNGAMHNDVKNAYGADASVSSFNLATAEGSTASSEVEVVTVEHLDPRDRPLPASPIHISSDNDDSEK